MTVLMLLVAVSPTAAATSVTTCGQEVEGSAVLNADLDCTGVADYAVVIHHGTLTLNSFTITGGRGVFCDGPCKVYGAGTITGSEWFGINGFGSALKVRNVTLTNNAIAAIQSYRNCKVEGPAPISNNGGGIRAAGNLTARDLTISDNTYDAIEAANNSGIARVSLRNVVITGNRTGILAQNGAKVVDSTISGNRQAGIIDGSFNCLGSSSLVALKNSTVIGNDTDPECGTTKVCFDIGVCPDATLPRLNSSTCEHSYVRGSGDPGTDLGVCTLD
jgi:hypothetical protein